MSTPTIPTPEQTAPNGTPDFSEADQPKRKTRLDRALNGIALAAAGVALAAAGALGGLTYAQHAVDTWQAEQARATLAAHSAEAAVNRGLARDGSHPGKYATGASFPTGEPGLVRVDLWDAATNKEAGNAEVTLGSDGMLPLAIVWNTP